MGDGEEAEEDQQSPLLLGFPTTMEASLYQQSESIKRTGTIWTAVAHIITGVIGAGVLSLAWSVVQLGWIAGPLLMIVFASVTIVSNNILADCYRYPDPHAPTRNRSYLEAVKIYLGDKLQTVSAVFVHESLYGCGIAYTITAASSVKFDGVRLWCVNASQQKVDIGVRICLHALKCHAHRSTTSITHVHTLSAIIRREYVHNRKPSYHCSLLNGTLTQGSVTASFEKT